MTRKRRVLMLRSSGFYGGPERQIHQHALASRRSNIEVVIGSFGVAGQVPHLLRIAADDGLETHLFKIRHSYDPTVVAQLRHYLIDFNIDILATHDYRSSIIGYFAVKNTQCRWLAWSRGSTYEGPKVTFFQYLENIFIRFADRVLVVAESQRRKLRRWLVPKRKFIVVHNAVDPERLAQVEPIDLRKKYSLPVRSVVVISAGRFSTEKGQQVLVQAVDAVIAKAPEIYFILFGEGPLLEQVRKVANGLRASDHIICPGFEKDIIGHIRGSDVLVNPSLTEGLPNVVLEAMALRVPTIATSVGGVPEIIIDNYNGQLVPENSPSALGNAIVRLASNQGLRDELGKAGFQTVVERFSFGEQNRKLQSVYNDILAD